MADTTTVDIVHATPADAPALSAALAEAFADDPVFSWVLPDADARRARLPAVFATFVDVFLPHGETYIAGDGAGGALWAPAGVEPVPEDRMEQFGQRMAAATGDAADRAFEVSELLEAHHPSDPCVYLQFLGVVPAQQRRGLGGRMLTRVLDRCDTTGTPAYLEATSVDNRRLYGRHGFVTVDELRLPDGPPLWPMWRDPVDAIG